MADVNTVGNPAKKMKISPRPRDEIWIASATREELVDRIIKQQNDIESSASHRSNDHSLEDLRETVEKLKHQVTESVRQESLLALRLAAKEQELHSVLALNQEMKLSRNPSLTQIQSMMLDPTVNLMFQHMRQEMDASKTKLEQAQSELAAWKFTPDSQTGKRLMAKCRMLLQENEEVGKAVSVGKIAKFEGDIALQKKLILEMKKSETDTEEFLGDMDEDLEQMQGTIYLLRQEIKETKERLAKYEHPPSSTPLVQPPVAVTVPVTATCNGDSVSATVSKKDVDRTGGVCVKLIKTEIADDIGGYLESRRGELADQSTVPMSDLTLSNNHVGVTDVTRHLIGQNDRGTPLIGQKDRGTLLIGQNDRGDDWIGKIVTSSASSTTVGLSVNCASRTTAVGMQIDDGCAETNGSPDCGYGTADSPGQEVHRATVGKLDAYRTS